MRQIKAEGSYGCQLKEKIILMQLQHGLVYVDLLIIQD